jgi:hypothetical protein
MKIHLAVAHRKPFFPINLTHLSPNHISWHVLISYVSNGVEGTQPPATNPGGPPAAAAKFRLGKRPTLLQRYLCFRHKRFCIKLSP